MISGLPDVPVVTDPADYDVYDLTSGFSASVDRYLRVTRGRTDIGGLAQLSAAECLSALCAGPSSTLFGRTIDLINFMSVPPERVAGCQ